MELVVFEVRDPRQAARGTVKSLRDWKRLLASTRGASQTTDHVFSMVDPEGLLHSVDLSHWANADPDRVFLRIAFRTRNPRIALRGDRGASLAV
jgi:hypothetical protein